MEGMNAGTRWFVIAALALLIVASAVFAFRMSRPSLPAGAATAGLTDNDRQRSDTDAPVANAPSGAYGTVSSDNDATRTDRDR